jgi:hypothetical protein
VVSFWGLVQLFLDLVLIASAGFLWVKLNRPAKDDPRLSKGLQLLGSKISIMEDLSDRTEAQVKQLTTLMEQKVREIQTTLVEAEKQIQKIEASMGKSLEVAKIFQDKIPHQEIIERQNTIKYVKAARLAHQGASVDEIMQQVDLPRGEVEFIAKVNRDQLQFSEADLPAWANDVQLPASVAAAAAEVVMPSAVRTQSETQVNRSLQGLGDQFRVAMSQQQIPQTLIDTPSFQAKAPQREVVRDLGVKKVVFPRIDA